MRRPDDRRTIQDMTTPNAENAPPQPLERELPPPIWATPSEIRLSAGEDEPTWWKPGWNDVRQFIGWRWILLAPMILSVALIVGGWYYPVFTGIAIPLGVKL